MNIISNLQQYGDYGWSWSERHIDYNSDYTEIESQMHYRTNGNGDGLWETDLTNSYGYCIPDKQVSGTYQFSLPNDKKSAYNKLYYNWSKRTE